MATYTWPTTRAFWPAAVRWRQVLTERATVSPLSGYSQAVAAPGTRWAMTLEMPQQTYAERRELAAFIERLEGRVHWVSIYDWVHPRPAGTANLTGVTLAAGAAQFAESLSLAGLGASHTLLAGDWLVVGGQRFRVVANATANGSGAATVSVRHQVRTALASGAAVGLDSPPSTFVLNLQGGETAPVPFGASNMAPPFTVELIEVWS